MQVLLWLDDVRDPSEKLRGDGTWLVFSPIKQPYEVIWVKSYQEFVNWINQNGLPTAICFDHDLGFTNEYYIENDIESPELEKTGMDCAKWLVDYCIDNNKKLPLYNIQSANPVGKANIDSLLKNFIKYQKI